MNNIKELLDSLNYDFKTTSRDFQLREIEMHIAIKSNENHDNSIIAKYLIFDFIEHQDLFIKITTDFFLFNEFQRINISPTFYSHRDDIRWNIYALFVVNRKEDLSSNISYIEKDEEYARKFIFTFNELNEFLVNGFLGKLDNNPHQIIKTNFLLEWDSILAKYDLNGCIYNKMKIANIEEYIVEEKPIRPIGRPLLIEKNTVSRQDVYIKRIKNVKMNSYRMHCFGKEFSYSPGLINLISGTNGSGKSSLCEAISLGMTGDNVNNKSNINETVSIECLGKNNEIINLSSKKTSKEKKEYDLAWYGTTTTGNKSNLHENFSIFNYIHSNAAHNGLKENLEVLLKNIMFGEETTKAWEIINNYKMKFIQYNRNYKNNLNTLQDEIDKLQLSIKGLDSLNKKYNLDELDTLGFQKLSDNDSYENMLSEMNSISFFVSSLEEIIKTENMFNSVPSIIDNYQLQIINKEELEKQYNEYIVIEEEIDKLGLQLEILNKELKNNNENKTELEKLYVEYTEYDFINFDNKIAMNNILNDAYKNGNTHKNLKEILNQYNIFYDYKKHIVFSEDELINVNNNLSKKEEDILEISKAITSKKNDVEITKRILTEISALGVNYLENHTDTGLCPLCGFDYGTYDDVCKAIRNVRTLNENLDFELETLIAQENILNNELNILKIRKENLLKAKALKDQYLEFILEMKKYNILVNVDAVPSVNYELGCSKMNEIKSQVDKQRDIISFLEKLKNNRAFMKFIEQDKILEFSKYIINAMKIYDLQQYKIKKDLDSIVKDIKEKKNLIEDFQIKKYEINKFNEKFIILKKAYENVNLIIDKCSEFSNIIDIQSWTLKYNNLKSIVRELVEVEKNNNMKNILLAQVKEKKKDFEREINSLNRSRRAIEAFDSLPTLEENMAYYIEENATNIEKIFKMLHRPEEFTDLVIMNGKVQFTRKTTKEIIDINDVSTGQAISLVFAITLCLHFSATNAPKFIILDEPVANLDDMHIMNLIDILKEIALSGVQLFITTANDQVATYFRRKFSCFNEEFKHLEIFRSDEKPSTFSEKVYSPYMEEPIVNKEIAI